MAPQLSAAHSVITGIRTSHPLVYIPFSFRDFDLITPNAAFSPNPETSGLLGGALSN